MTPCNLFDIYKIYGGTDCLYFWEQVLTKCFATVYQNARHQIQEYRDSECYKPRKPVIYNIRLVEL